MSVIAKILHMAKICNIYFVKYFIFLRCYCNIFFKYRMFAIMFYMKRMISTTMATFAGVPFSLEPWRKLKLRPPTSEGPPGASLEYLVQ